MQNFMSLINWQNRTPHTRIGKFGKFGKAEIAELHSSRSVVWDD
jgi:hypothetical protein